MNKQQFIKWLENNEDGEEGIKWVESQKTLKQAWENCTNAIWMLWLLERLSVPDSTLRLLACDFVRYTPLNDGRTVWDLLTDERSRNAVIVAERYALGEASQDDLTAAWGAASFVAWDLAWGGAWVAAWNVASSPANAAARDAARISANVAAWDESRAAQCEIIRKRISWEDLKSLLGGVA